ncbi:hypothetical protein OAQ84_00800 [Bdellovibrionales bacterium]|nr:hypothetical protein [Bdellovibrionales bacterium]
MDIQTLKVGVDMESAVISKLGLPKEKLIRKDKEFGAGKMFQWNYDISGYNRLSVFLVDNVLQSVSWDIWESDPEFKIENILSKVDANFEIIKEPVRNPHAMPSKCYLVDNKKGISIKVDSYKKAAIFLSFWNPKLSKKTKWFDDSTPEFCIAGLCSKVTDPKAWKHNHCEWLEKLVKRTRN